MELIVMILALGLTAAEKLNREYLPPPGAKFSGGSLEDLQTPLEYPKETSNNVLRDFKYPTAYSKNTDVNVSSLGKMPIISVLESIGQNYQPHIFGMYGGNPMIIKSYGKNIDNPLDDLITSDEVINVPQKNFIPYESKHLSRNQENVLTSSTTVKPNEATTHNIPRNRSQKLITIKSERLNSNTDRNALTHNYKNVQNPEGYSYNFDTSNGIHREEIASTLNGVKAKGSYSYKGDDGKVYTVTYTADENGFQPRGDHLPAIPVAIQRVIEQAKKDNKAGIFDDGSYNENKYGHMKYEGTVNRFLYGISNNKNRRKAFANRDIFQIFSDNGAETDNFKNGAKYKGHKNENNNILRMKNVKFYKTQQNIRKQDEHSYHQSEKALINQHQHHSNQPRIKTSIQNKSTLRLKALMNQNQQIQHYKDNLSNKLEKNITLESSQHIHSAFNNNRSETNFQEGYVYVPPQNIFIEGKYQTTQLNDKILSTPVPDSNYIDQIDNTDNSPENNYTEVTQLYAVTEKPITRQTYDRGFYEITSPVIDQFENVRTVTEKPLNRNILAITTPLPYSNTYVNAYGQEITKEIVMQEDNVMTENNDEIHTNTYQSTTPMPSEVRYKIESYNDKRHFFTLSNSDENYFQEEGYFNTPPEVTATYENFPTSTQSPINTFNGISRELNPNVRVDGFGRPIQEYTYTESPNIVSIQSTPNDEYEITEPKSTPVGNKYEEDSKNYKTLTPTDASITEATYSFGSTVTSDDMDIVKDSNDSIIGEDFSGPKQPQRYDPKNGYYY